MTATDVGGLLAGLLDNPDDDQVLACLCDALQESPGELVAVVRGLLRGGAGRKCWLSSNGRYSDYGIDAVFLSRAEAEAYERDCRTANPDGDHNDLQEFVVGRPEGSEYCREVWQSEIDLMSGDITHVPGPLHKMAGNLTDQSAGVIRGYNTAKNLAESVRTYPADRVVTVGSYKSQQHADKLAAEFRQEFIRLCPLDLLVAEPGLHGGRYGEPGRMRFVGDRPPDGVPRVNEPYRYPNSPDECTHDRVIWENEFPGGMAGYSRQRCGDCGSVVYEGPRFRPVGHT